MSPRVLSGDAPAVAVQLICARVRCRRFLSGSGKTAIRRRRFGAFSTDQAAASIGASSGPSMAAKARDRLLSDSGRPVVRVWLAAPGRDLQFAVDADCGQMGSAQD